MGSSRKSPAKLGITGGIGSGKSSVCRVFTILGVPVFSADPVAREIVVTDPYVRENINKIAGRNLYRNGELDRVVLATLIFNDKLLLGKVNALVHPLVLTRFQEWAVQQEAPYIIMEAAILFESGASKLVDRVATVVAPLEERISRVMHRNTLTREQVLERTKNQMDDEDRIRQSDYVIRNSENEMIIPAILEIHLDMLNLAKERC